MDITTKQEYLNLVQTANHHADLYYNQDQTEITDTEYDEITEQLKRIEAEHPDWSSPDSPTRHVSGKAKSGFQKVRHEIPLLSLNDLFDINTVEQWHDNLNQPEVVVEEKIDGLTIALTYINGMLAQAVTRGDGTIGELVTEQAKQVEGIPERIKIPDGVEPNNKIIIRSEVHQPVAAFEACNKIQEDLGEKLFANPRNCAAGGLRAKDPKITAARNLRAIAFQIIETEGWENVRSTNISDKDLTLLNQAGITASRQYTQEHDIELLEAIGLIPVTQYFCENQNQLLQYIEIIGDNRENLPYWTDGAVIKTNSILLQQHIGQTVKYPLHSVAYKYPAEKKRTTIRKINVTVGRTGKLIPVAEFDPIQLGGSTVTHATLHNQKFLNDNLLNIGAEIEVLKSGEIIPKVVGVPVPSDTTFEIKTCPVCGSAAVISSDTEDSGSIVMMCPNMTGCPAQKLRYFEFFVSRDVMDIRDMGPQVLQNLIQAGLLNNIWDIYDLKNHIREMLQLDGLGEKKIMKILNAIEDSKKNDIDRLIKALGIPGIGRHIGQSLAKSYASMDDIANLRFEDLIAMDGIGNISANAILDFWADTNQNQRYYMLKARGVNTQSLTFNKNTGGTKLSDLTFVITGTLPTMSRDQAKTLIQNNGGKVSGSVSKKTDYLLTGEAAGSKLEKAKSLGVKIISESDLMVMLD